MVLQKFCICVHIIHNLGYQSADINRVSRGELISGISQFFFQLPVLKQSLHSALGIIKVAVDGNYGRILSFLCHHLQFLYPAHTVLWIKYNNLRTRYIRESRQGSFPRIPGGCRQNDDILCYVVFPGCSCQQVRQNGKRHILKRNGSSVEKFQVISIPHLDQRRNYICVKLLVICTINTVLQFFFGKIS